MLELKNISKSYKTGDFVQKALNGVSIKFRKNEFAAILGPSGSGKTTLLNIVGGLDRYDKGDLVISGTSTKKFNDKMWDAYRNNSIGFVFQSYNLIGHISIVENVEMGMTLNGMSASKRRKKALKVLDRVGLKDHVHKKPNQLSGGQMQRVAIARALANNPEVILADEPTGALDTKTSVQIMELITEIAKDKLVIMVTHNEDLANEYANRTITMRDGVVEGDTNPIEEKNDEKEEYKLKKTAMNFWTALKLSFNNIRTKKGRTLITAFASSIGIIGIALILSLSNGFKIQIDKFEHDTLANFPIMVSKTAMDLSEESMVQIQNSNQKDGRSYTSESSVYPYKSEINTIRHENILSKEYIEYVNNIDKKLLSGISYTRIAALNMLYKTDDKVSLISSGNMGTGMAAMQQTFASIPKKVNNNEKGFVENNYDILSGKLATSKEELVLIVDSKNRVNIDTLKLFGVDASAEKISFEELIGKELKLVLNDEFYKQNGNYFTLNTDFNAMYNSENALTLKIVGIMRGKEGNSLFSSENGIGYTEELMDYVIEKNTSSKIGQKQIASDYNVLTGEKIDLTTEEGISTKENLVSYLGASNIPYAISIYPKDFNSKEEITNYLDDYNNKLISEYKDDVQKYLDALVAKITTENDALLNKVDNSLVEGSSIDKVELKYKNSKLSGTIVTNGCEYKIENNEITKTSGGVMYTDYAAAMISLSGSIMDAITVVLIAFSAISLVVSSIMIGIITYISVLERTKEIGILRALGARKKDISRVFNAETFIIGLTSGLIGILIAVLLTFPANAIIYDLTDLKNVAQLNPLHALMLIVVSVTLTVIGGLIPSKVASKKDPVIALRTE